MKATGTTTAPESGVTKKRIIVGEDDSAIRSALVEFLESLDYEVVGASTCASIRAAFRESSPDAAVLDYSLPDGTALDLLPQLKQSHPSVPVILLTGNGTIQLAVRAIKEGAEQFFTKPVEMSAIAVVLERLLKNQRTQQKQLAGKEREKRENVNPFRARVRQFEKLQSRQRDCPSAITRC